MGDRSDTSNDMDLVHRAKGGELSAFEALTLRYERQVYSLARRILRHEQDAEDITQQTFLSALEHLETFREESSFSTWLFRIATFAALKVLRKRKGLNLADPADEGYDSVPHPSFIADWRESPQMLVQRAETRRAIEEALALVPEKYRLVFLLRDVQGLSVRETATALGITEANVKVRLLRARLQLREELTRLFGDTNRQVPPHSH
jgi:RNA polymerase sigma-70 factor (ECF subfamily)